MNVRCRVPLAARERLGTRRHGISNKVAALFVQSGQPLWPTPQSVTV
jgi:hypothetical protein